MMLLRLIHRELRLALSGGLASGLGMVFFLIVAALVPFAVGPDAPMLARIAVGMIWIAALLASLLTLERLFAPDSEDGTLDQYLSGGMSAELLALAKIISHWLLSGLPLILATPLAALLLGLPGAQLGQVMLALCLGTPALSALGAIAAALSVGIKRGGMLISLLVLPMMIPTLIFGVGSVADASALLLLAACSLIALALAPFACGAALRLAIA